MADGSVQGSVHDRYAAVRTQFEENLRKGDGGGNPNNTDLGNPPDPPSDRD